MRYLDVCSGYSAFTLGAAGLGFECAGYSEIEPFPRAVLEQRHSAVATDWDHRHRPGSNVTPLFGDFTQIEAHHVGPVQLLTGGTPCQAFSVAGKRLGLDDPRGNLTLEFLALARRVRAEWLVWENVPGILSHDDGRTMGTFLRLLGDLGYGWAYRVLDAQYVRVDGFAGAVPQRRRRVFVVAHLGDAAGPAAVLFERESLRGDPAPRREAGEGVAGAPSASTGRRGGVDDPERGGLIAGTLSAAGSRSRGAGTDPAGITPVGYVPEIEPQAMSSKWSKGSSGPAGDEVANLIAQPIAASLTRGAESAGKGGYAGRRQEDDVNLVAHALRADGFDASKDGTGRGTPLVPVVFGTHDTNVTCGTEVTLTLRAADNAARNGKSGNGLSVADGWAVRRLTPIECERLMGVPDGFTDVTYRGKPAADGPRYKALGNSQAVNVMRWIARGLRDVVEAQRHVGSTMDAAA